MQTYRNFSKISIPSAIKCTKVNCKSSEHRLKIDLYYSEICNALHCSSLDSIPSSKSSDCRDYIVPEFNDYVKDLAYIVPLVQITLLGEMQESRDLEHLVAI